MTWTSSQSWLVAEPGPWAELPWTSLLLLATVSLHHTLCANCSRASVWKCHLCLPLSWPRDTFLFVCLFKLLCPWYRERNRKRERGSVSRGCFQLSMVCTARFIFIWGYASAYLWGTAIWQNPIHTHTFPKAEFNFPIKINFVNFSAMKRLWLSFPAPLSLTHLNMSLLWPLLFFCPDRLSLIYWFHSGLSFFWCDSGRLQKWLPFFPSQYLPPLGCDSKVLPIRR